MEQNETRVSAFHKLVQQLVDEHEHELTEAQAENRRLIEKLQELELKSSTSLLTDQATTTSADVHLVACQDPLPATPDIRKAEAPSANALAVLPTLLHQSQPVAITSDKGWEIGEIGKRVSCLSTEYGMGFDPNHISSSMNTLMTSASETGVIADMPATISTAKQEWVSQCVAKHETHVQATCFREWQRVLSAIRSARSIITFTVHPDLANSETGEGSLQSVLQGSSLFRFQSKSTVELRHEHVVVVNSERLFLCRPMLISPGGNLRNAWDLVGTGLLAYDVVMIPMSSFGLDRTVFVVGMEWVTLLFWTMDIIMSCLTGVQENGKVYMDPVKIISIYLRTWFLIDLVSVVPDWVFKIIDLMDASNGSGGAAGTGKLLRALRVARTLRVLRLAKLRRILQMAHDRIDSEFIFIIISIVKLMIMLIMLNHFLAAIWWFIGSLARDANMPNWIDSQDLFDRSVFYRYLTALHWTFCMFTPGSMNVQPQNVPERSFAVVVLAFGMVVFTQFISSMTAAVQQLKQIQGDSEKHLWMLRRFLRQHSVCPDLSYRVVWYVENVLREINARKVQEEKVAGLSMLTKQLRAEVKYETSFVCLNAHPLLDRIKKDSKVTMLCLVETALTQQVLAPTEVLFSSGGCGTHMHIVVSGALQYIKAGLAGSREFASASSRRRQSVIFYSMMGGLEFSHQASQGSETQWIMANQDDWLCEPVLWTKWTYLGVACAMMESELVSIQQKELMKVLRADVQSWTQVCRYASSFVTRLSQKTLGQLSDLCKADEAKHLAAEVLREIDIYRRVSASSESSASAPTALRFNLKARQSLFNVGSFKLFFFKRRSGTRVSPSVIGDATSPKS